MREVLVVGCGSIGARHIRNLSKMPVEVVAHDIDEERVRRVEDQHDVVTTTDTEKAFESGPDCVLVCTPPDTHVELALKAVEAGAHVFVEKPIAASSQEAQRFVERVSNSDSVGLVGCNMRFHPPVEQIRAWLDAGRIGRIEFIRLRYGNYLPNWREGDYTEWYSASEHRGGGILLDAIHELDLAEAWLGDVTTVTGLTDKLSDLKIDVEDTVELVLQSEAAMAEVHLDYLRPVRARTYELIGTDGMIRWAAEGKHPEESTLRLVETGTGEVETLRFDSNLNEMYVREMEHFFACIDGDETPVIDASRGTKLLQLAERAEEASNEGQTL